MTYLKIVRTAFFNFAVNLSLFLLEHIVVAIYWFRSSPRNHKRFSFCCKRCWNKVLSREWLFDMTPAKYKTRL